MQQISVKDTEYVYRVCRVLSECKDEYSSLVCLYVEDIKIRKTAGGARKLADRMVKENPRLPVLTQSGRIEWWNCKYTDEEVLAAVVAANPDIEPVRLASVVQLALQLVSTPG